MYILLIGLGTEISLSGQRNKIVWEGRICARAFEETLLILLVSLFCTSLLLKFGIMKDTETSELK